MPKDVLLLSSSRAYEFPPDGVRLTGICTEQVMAAVKSAFDFNLAVIGSPMPTFGPVVQTLPPGAAFNFGIVEAGGQVVPIRYLHIESTRLVVDVAGPSAAIDAIRSRLTEVLAGVPTTAAGAMVDPVRVRDKTTIVSTLSFPPEALFPAPVLHALGSGEFAAVLAWHSAPIDAPLDVVQAEEADAWTLQLRAGEPPAARRYFSSAPITSDAHLEFLARLEKAEKERPSARPKAMPAVAAARPRRKAR